MIVLRNLKRQRFGLVLSPFFVGTWESSLWLLRIISLVNLVYYISYNDFHYTQIGNSWIISNKAASQAVEAASAGLFLCRSRQWRQRSYPTWDVYQSDNAWTKPLQTQLQTRLVTIPQFIPLEVAPSVTVDLALYKVIWNNVRHVPGLLAMNLIAIQPFLGTVAVFLYGGSLRL